MNRNAFLFLLLCLLPSISSVSSQQHNSQQQPKATTTTTGGSSQPSTSQPQKGSVPGVIELTTITLDSNIRNGDLWMIEFYAPWCSACVQFAGSYAKLAHYIHSTNSERKRPIHVAKINGDKERASVSRFNIRSYPTIFVVDGWKVYEFEGARSEEALLKFVLQEGYKDQHPLPIWSSPMGPLGQVQALVFYIGRIFFGFYNYLVSTKGFTPAMAAFIFAFGGISTGLVAMITIAIVLSGKIKED